ncbi:zinc finger CCCH domain-containing protein 14-like [Tasmannia lanceolata]|uniref:zinc finger CCCH domain-containing protein 14-like n=1 Tax=Tasmannia lanceolata TaxID=3420 RepID=UPI00406333FB
MQNENGFSNGGTGISTAMLSQNQRITLLPQMISSGSDLTSLYSSIFAQKESLPNSESISLTPSSCSCDEENAKDTENSLYLARISLQYKEMVERYGICLSHLRQTEQEAEALREENAKLRIANVDLSKRLSLLSISGKQSSLQNRIGSASFPAPLSVMNDYRRFCMRDVRQNDRLSSELSETSPTSVLGFEENRFERRNVDRISLPKSISIRSSGFLKGGLSAGNKASSSRTSTRLREASPQRVCVPGVKKEEEALEFEVYNQGMIKTELCNKWQETGTCPYGEHCQFAHGIGELRPVIRHPRYKTEVCRMVLAGDMCPYGHRCHFRHALTEQEKFVGPQ